MKKKGSFESSKGARIDIYIKEYCGNEPHIHLRDQHGNICRIKLRTNEYQRDAYEKENGHVLNKNEVKAFNKYMHSLVPGTNLSNWERLSADWNECWAANNKGSGGLVNISKGCPNYSIIKKL